LDQDDLADHRRLEKQVDYLSKYECSVLGTWVHKINNNSKVIYSTDLTVKQRTKLKEVINKFRKEKIYREEK